MKYLLPLLTLCLVHTTFAKNPVEVGNVGWKRDHDAALEESRVTGKPVFVLFQEVPGCAGCQQFGREVLTEPLLVEAIENEFVPLLIYNNKGGKDAELLKQYREPAWNYQVIRFLDASGKDIIPRKDRIWSLDPLVDRMIATLEFAKRPVPAYLKSMAAGKPGAQLETAAFAMYCFWTGEMHLGRIDGVVSTQAGWFEGREVTLVYYDPSQLSFADLAKAAADVQCAQKVYTTTAAQESALGKTRLQTGKLTTAYRPASAGDQKKQIAGTPFAKLDLNPQQATKVNSWARTDPQKALQWLSPSQRIQLERLASK